MNGVFKEKFTWWMQWKKQPITKFEIIVAIALSLLCFLALFFQQGNYPELTNATSIAGVLLIFFVSLVFYEHEYKKISRGLIWSIITILIALVIANYILISTEPKQQSYVPNYPTHNMAPKILPA